MTHGDLLLKQLEQQFTLTKGRLAPIIHGFIKECKHGLQVPSKDQAIMIPSFVTTLPTGTETGTFLSLDLGGTNLRISAVELKGAGQVNVLELKKCPSQTLKTGEAAVFFDWIASAVAEMVHIHARHLFAHIPQPLLLGVCWSFPIDQTAVNRGTVLRMGKGYMLQGVEGRDLADLFHEAFQRQNLHVRVTAILNDTVGTLVAHAYSNPKVRIGLIYATGINAAYPEKLSSITKLAPTVRCMHPPSAMMLVNTELDIFGNDSYLPRTHYDKLLDSNHNQPCFQLFEKMVSGAYLGELVRLIAIDFVHAGVLFGGVVPEGLEEPWTFPTSVMGALEAEHALTLEKGVQILDHLHFVRVPTLQDMAILTRICRIVATRSAMLVSAAIASLIEQQGLDQQEGDIVVGINGSTYELYPHMEQRLRTALQVWFGPSVTKRIKLEVAKDGGSIGSALVAMLCSS